MMMRLIAVFEQKSVDKLDKLLVTWNPKQEPVLPYVVLRRDWFKMYLLIITSVK